MGVIQRNAIESWTKLEPRPEIILLGNDEGTMELAHGLGLRHLPNVARSDHGTPLLGDLFRQAEAAATWPYMCYVNLDIAEKLNFGARWEEAIKLRASATGKDEHYTGIDVFVFPKGMYPQIPDFAIGRLWFDHWLIKAVRQQDLPVVDASLVAPVLHQNHDYDHVAGGKEQVWRGEEAERNFQLYGGVEHAYTLLDVTHEVTPDGSIRRVRFRRTLFKMRQFAWEVFVRRTAAFRKALGLRRKFRHPAGHQSS